MQHVNLLSPSDPGEVTGWAILSLVCDKIWRFTETPTSPSVRAGAQSRDSVLVVKFRRKRVKQIKGHLLNQVCVKSMYVMQN